MKKILFVCVALVAGVAFAAGPVSPPSGQTVTGDDEGLGITMAEVKKCTGCHGKQLEGKKKAPAMDKFGKAAILAALGHGIAADKIGESVKPDGKVPKAMKGVAKKLSDAEKEAVAAWIGANCKKGEGCKVE